jgi:hypothetical protein
VSDLWIQVRFQLLQARSFYLKRPKA